MGDLIGLMAAPFAACVVLIGIHAYLGMHVIERKVIFVDLALAQIAALGATLGFLLGISPHGGVAYFFSLGFAIVGAAIFSLTRMRHERIPQEAIIGIVYAVALASTILIADRAPEGAEHIKETMVGAILWVGWPEILKTAVIYAIVGGIHIVLHKPLFQITFDPDAAYAEGRRVRFWDFVFYVTFAFVITSSVAMAGVLLVFSFLVIPAVIATLFADAIWKRLAIGWSAGIVACGVGLFASWELDLPSGPAVVSALGLALVLAGILYTVRVSKNRAGALAKAGTGFAVALVTVAVVWIMAAKGAFLQIDHEHEWEDGAGTTQVHAPNGRPADSGAVTDPLDAALAAADGQVTPESIEAVARASDSSNDPLRKIDAARWLAGAGDARGARLAATLLGADSPPLVRDEAHALLRELSDRDFGYDPFGDPDSNARAISEWKAWAAGAT